MRKVVLFLLGGFSLALLVLLVSCKPEPIEGEERYTYVYTQQITNPPDDFMILFNTLSVGQKVARMTTGDSAVWLIDRIGDGRQTIALRNDTGFYNLNIQDTIGLYANKDYEIIVTTFLYGEANNLFVGFRKLDMEFSSFNPKF